MLCCSQVGFSWLSTLSCLTSTCFFCALSSAFSSPLSSASAPSSWWLFHSTVIPSTPSSASALPSQACPFTSSSSECQSTNDLFASAGLWVSLGSSSRLSYCTAWFFFFGFFCKSSLPNHLRHSSYPLLRLNCNCPLGPSPIQCHLNSAQLTSSVLTQTSLCSICHVVCPGPMYVSCCRDGFGRWRRDAQATRSQV